MTNKTQTTFRVDAELLRKFRYALVERETKMTPVIEKLIREWLHVYELKARHAQPKSISAQIAPSVAASKPSVRPPGEAAAAVLAGNVTTAIVASGTQSIAPPPPQANWSSDPWVSVLEKLQRKINKHTYDTWLGPTRYSHSDNGIMYVRVPAVEFRYAGDKYAPLIREALDDLHLDYQDVQFLVDDQDPNGAISHNEYSHTFESAVKLNSNFTFDTFVVGNGNQFAHAASQAVAQSPSRAYNPLFLYGGVGMGKTHLIQAIGHEIRRSHPKAGVCYITSEKFTHEMINSLRYDKMTSFRERLRNVDVLLIDDIQFLAQKERTQEEFFHTFNDLHESMKQIVIASDRPPNQLEEIEDRLRNRFEWGLMADMQPPDLETKVAIVQKKAEQYNAQLPNDVALLIASNIQSNVRELEGSVIRLVAHSSLLGGEITLPYAQEVLKGFIDSQPRRITIEAIQKAVATQFGLRTTEIKSRNNSRAIAYPRQIAMYLAKHLTDASWPEIGREFGDKHHTTVIRSAEKIDRLRKVDKDLNRFLNKLTTQLAR